MRANAPCLLLFARAPEAARVKTRLEPALGPGGASALYYAFLEDAARRYAPGPDWRGVLCADPDPSSPGLSALFPAPWRRRAQSPGDLGRRLEAAFRGAFHEGAPAAVALGSDHPALSRARVEEVFESLASGHPAALIPAEDGGYCAIGLRAGAPLADIFAEIPWSTAAVLETTLRRLASARLAVRLLDASYDVDRPEDVARLARDLARRDPDDGDFPRATAAAIAALVKESRA